MKQLIRKTFAAFVCVFTMSFAHAGIPVVDTVLNPQTLINQVANYAEYVAQLVQMEQQVQQAIQMYNSVTGARGMSGLLNNPAVRSTLPPAYGSVVSAIKSGATYAAERAALPTSTNPKINAIYDSVAVNKAALTDAYAQASARQVQVQQLQAQIDSASDPAAKQDLQNRMTSELQSIHAQSQLLAMLQPKQEQDNTEAREAAHRNFICTEFANASCP